MTLSKKLRNWIGNRGVATERKRRRASRLSSARRSALYEALEPRMLLAGDALSLTGTDVIVFNADGTMTCNGEEQNRPVTLDTGRGVDTLDFSAITGNLSFTFDVSGSMTVTNGTDFSISVSNAERVIGSDDVDTLDFSAITGDLRFTFDNVEITPPDVDVTLPDVDGTLPDVDVTLPDVDVTLPTVTVFEGITVTNDLGNGLGFDIFVTHVEELIGGNSGSEVFITGRQNPFSGDDLIISEDAADTNRLIVEPNGSMPSISFPKAVSKATIELGAGDDSLTFEDLGSGVTAEIEVADSTTIGRGIPTVSDDARATAADFLLGNDTVTFAGNTFLEGANLTVSAETIIVETGVTVSTRNVVSGSPENGTSSGDSGNIEFSGRTIQIDSVCTCWLTWKSAAPCPLAM